jgi:hypothetical protein
MAKILISMMLSVRSTWVFHKDKNTFLVHGFTGNFVIPASDTRDKNRWQAVFFPYGLFKRMITFADSLTI